MKNESLWMASRDDGDFEELAGDIEVDVLIVGAGITGLTSAYLLKQSGRRVAVVEQHEIAQGETAHTTAHVTYVTDVRLSELVSKLGEDEARGFWEAGAAAMVEIQRIANELEIDCDLKEVPGYLFAAVDKDLQSEIKTLRQDAELAGEFNFDAVFVETDGLFGRPAVRFPNQLKFHPVKYALAVAKAVHGDGSYVFTNTSGSHIDGEKHELRTNAGTIRYDAVLAATHVPIQGERGDFDAAFFQTKLAAYSTYAIAAEIPTSPESLYWDTNDPYLYLRVDQHENATSVIIGGEDHKTGQNDDTASCYERLEAVLMKIFPEAKPYRRWSGQVIETPDGLPYIGEVGERQYVATGFSGTGMTMGTFSAMLLRDLILGHPNPWAGLFDPARKRAAGAFEYLAENKDFPARFIADRFRVADSADDVAPGTGKVARVDGNKCAVYCDDDGKLSVLSAICPHMGCIVAWNQAEKTWDCPCHGSRFTATGDLMAGPAETGLATH